MLVLTESQERLILELSRCDAMTPHEIAERLNIPVWLVDSVQELGRVRTQQERRQRTLERRRPYYVPTPDDIDRLCADLRAR